MIRIAQRKDLPRIVEIYNQAVEERGSTADLDPATVASRATWFEGHDPRTYPIWIAESDGSVAGWCCLSPHRPGRKAVRDSAEISYYVDRSHRRKGIATSLVKHAISQCPGLEIKTLFTWILEVNVSSIRVLIPFGFTEWGHLPNIAEIDGKRCGQLIYGKSID